MKYNYWTQTYVYPQYWLLRDNMIINICLCALVAQSYLTLCDPMTMATRLLCPLNFSEKNTGVGCHFLHVYKYMGRYRHECKENGFCIQNSYLCVIKSFMFKNSTYIAIRVFCYMRQPVSKKWGFQYEDSWRCQRQDINNTGVSGLYLSFIPFC